MITTCTEKHSYVLAITGCVEIEKHGPFRSEQAFQRAAARIHQQQKPETDGLFWLEVDFKRQKVKVGEFSPDCWGNEGE